MTIPRALGAAGALLALAAGSFFFACSSNSTDPGVDTSPPKDGGAPGNRIDSGASDSGYDAGAPTDAGDDAADAAPSCHPPTLHPPPPDAGVYCPFSGVDGGNDLLCARATEKCCETPSDDAGASTCNTVAAACPVTGSTAWECEDSVDCAAGKVCCAQVTLTPDSVCGYLRGSGFNGTSCKAACATGEVVICQQPSSCTTGTCTPFRVAGNSVGACR